MVFRKFPHSIGMELKKNWRNAWSSGDTDWESKHLFSPNVLGWEKITKLHRQGNLESARSETAPQEQASFWGFHYGDTGMWLRFLIPKQSCLLSFSLHTNVYNMRLQTEAITHVWETQKSEYYCRKRKDWEFKQGDCNYPWVRICFSVEFLLHCQLKLKDT